MKVVLLAHLCVALLFQAAATAQEVPAGRPHALYVNGADDAARTFSDLAALARSGDWAKAAETAQRHIETGGGKLFDIGGGVYISFAEKARRLVLAWPEAGIRAYRARYDARAATLFETAHAARDVRGLAEVARLYAPSSVGAKTLAALADVRVQRGELRAAERALTLAARMTPREALEAKLRAVRAALVRKDVAARVPPAGLGEIGPRRWSLGIENADVDTKMAAGLRTRGMNVPRIAHAVIAGGKVCVQTSRWIGAVDVATGKVLWRYPERLVRPTGRDCADAMLRPAVRGGRVYAFVAGELVALAANSGRRVWRASSIVGDGAVKRAKGVAAPKVLVNSVTVEGEKVFACAAVVGQETASVVVAADARTGAILWRRKLGSHLFRGVLGRGVHPAPAVCSEGTVFVSTNLGAVAAIDAETGEVRWLTRYASFPAARRRAAFDGDNCWRNGPPVVCGGLLIVAPQDADNLIAFDAATGRQKWSMARQRMRYLVGAADGRVYVSGTRVAAIDTGTGKGLWLSKEIGPPAGRPALVKSGMLVPTGRSIVRVDAKTGAVRVSRPLEHDREPGNLAVADGWLLSASYDRVDACADAPLSWLPVKPEPPAKTPAYDKTKKLTLAWSTPFDLAHSSPVLVASDEATVFIATKDRGKGEDAGWHAVERRRISNGQLIWRIGIGEWRARGHVVKDVFVAQTANALVAVDASTGAAKWRSPGEVSKTAPHIIDSVAGAGRVFIARASGDVAAVDVRTGARLWLTRLRGPARSDGLYVSGGRVVVCLEAAGAILWLDPATGKTTREVRIDRKDARLTDKPALQAHSGRLCVVVGDREVWNLRLDTGKTLWKSEMPFAVGRVAATPDEKRIVVFPDRWSLGGEVTCFDAATGERVWRRKLTVVEPAAACVGNGLIVSCRRRRSCYMVSASRVRDAKPAWLELFKAQSRLDKITDVGTFIVATGTALGPDGFRGRAAVMTRRGGSVVALLNRPGSAQLSVAGVGGTLLLLSDRGIEAHRMTSEEAIARRLAELSKAASPPAQETAWLQVGLGQHEKAMAILEERMTAKSAKPGEFVRLHDQLMSIRELCGRRRPATYEAPFFRVPPEMDGRLREDWRRDRAAIIEAPRFIERLHGAGRVGKFWAGPADLSATMYLAWDNTNLYLAVDVRDDTQTPHDFHADNWQGDCLIVAVDPEGNGGYRMHGLDEAFWLAMAAKPPRGDGPRRLGGMLHAKVKDDKSGAVYEVAIPWKELGVAPRIGLRFGLNIMMVDDDGQGATKAASWTLGLTQHRNRAIMADEMAPALFGNVILKER